QRVMLHADATAIVDKGLEVLIVVVDLVLDRQDRFDEIAILRALARLERENVVEISQPVGDRTLGQGDAVERGNDAYHVDDLSLTALIVELARRDTHDVELLGLEAEGLRT